MLGELLAIGAALLGGANDTDNHRNNINDDDMYACTDEWRSLHPYDYNPVTGGCNADEDSENGW